VTTKPTRRVRPPAKLSFRDLVASEPDRWEIEQLLDDVSRLLLTVRDLERIGDHAVNIAARTLYANDSDRKLIY